MTLRAERYLDQFPRWPAEGRHILAQYDDAGIVVYQAYSPAIGDYAAEHGHFGGPFGYNRMSWIKPNFLWMMYRSGWGTKPGQEVVLAVRLRRGFFDRVLAQAVPSRHEPEIYPDADAWRAAVSTSAVRLQWDPDHDPSGAPVARRAIQLGLRGLTLVEYGRDAILSIEDVSGFVAEQRERAQAGRLDLLVTPSERVYAPADRAVARKLGLSAPP